jgi:hypothetical protein
MNPELINCDVLVAGGGSAGMAAAIAAARKGASVVLLEKNSFMGGKATAAYVGTVCGLYYCSKKESSTYVSDGFAFEFAEKLKAKSGTSPILNKHGLHFLPYKPFDFKILCDEFIHSEKVKVFFQSVVSDVEKDNAKIVSVSAVSYDRIIKIQPKVVIDCTGEALLSVLSRASVIESEEYQAPAQVFSMEGVEVQSEANLSLIILKEFQKAISEGSLSEDYSGVSVVPGSLNGKRVYLKIGIPVKIKNEVNKISSVEFTARKMVTTVSQFLKEKIEAFKNAHISDVASEAGVRTGRRHRGKYILTKEDVLTCEKSVDSAGRGTWPIEFWEFGKRVKMDFFEFDNYYDIPKDCLISSDVKNLLFAGRNISATEEAIASARVIGTCLQTGYAAGDIAAGMISLNSL